MNFLSRKVRVPLCSTSPQRKLVCYSPEDSQSDAHNRRLCPTFLEGVGNGFCTHTLGLNT